MRLSGTTRSFAQCHPARSISIVDRILKGESPAEMPIEQPIKFYMAVNRQTAAERGIEIPDSVLLQADEIVERPIPAGLRVSGRLSARVYTLGRPASDPDQAIKDIGRDFF